MRGGEEAAASAYLGLADAAAPPPPGARAAAAAAAPPPGGHPVAEARDPIAARRLWEAGAAMARWSFEDPYLLLLDT